METGGAGAGQAAGQEGEERLHGHLAPGGRAAGGGGPGQQRPGGGLGQEGELQALVSAGSL